MSKMNRTVSAVAIVLVGMMVAMAQAQTSAPATRPAPAGSAMPRNPNLPSLWLIGDSTMQEAASGGTGWGAAIAKMFDNTKINVVNRARGGRSSRSYQVEGLWDGVLALVKPGDFLILQMGHNDGGQITNPNGRASLPGIGDDSQEITKADGSKEVVHTYGWYMRKYVADAKAKKVNIIICSSVPHAPRADVKEGDVERSGVVGWAEEVAKSQNVPFIHMNKLIMGHYVGMTPADVRAKYFTPPGDGTHTSPAGGELNASCFVDGLKQQKDLELNKYLAAAK